MAASAHNGGCAASAAVEEHLVRVPSMGYNMWMLKTPLIAAGAVVAGCYLVWRRAKRSSAGAALAPGIVIDPSKAKAIFELGKEAVGASVEQALNARHAA